MFCSKCGEPISNGSNFCPKCGSKISGNDTNKDNRSETNRSEHTTHNGYTVYEKFDPLIGFLDKAFVLTDRSIITEGNEYLYSDIDGFSLAGSTFLTGGTLNVVVKDKKLIFDVPSSQGSRLKKMVDYAKGQINKAHGIEKNLKFELYDNGKKVIEVFEDYISFRGMDVPELEIVKGAIASWDSGINVEFSDLNIEMNNTESKVIFKFGEHFKEIGITDENYQTVKDIIAFIDTKKDEANKDESILKEKWKKIESENRTFFLQEGLLFIPKEMDAYNQYRLRYRNLASQLTDKAKEETKRRVHNLATYLEFFPQVYDKYLGILVDMSIDILLLEGIINITKEQFLSDYKKNYHKAIDQFDFIVSSVNVTSAYNQRSGDSISNGIPDMVGGGFGMKNAVKGMAKAEAFNFSKAFIGSVVSSPYLDDLQQDMLLLKVDFNELFELVFYDYYNVYSLLIIYLKSVKKPIWQPTEKNMETANNIFKNMSNPNFPENQKVDVFTHLLLENPYNKDFHKYMIAQWGENEETIAIKNYFGFTEFDNPRIY